MYKLAAISSMFIDHFAIMFFDNGIYLAGRLVGRFAYPYFCYAIKRGYDNTKNLADYKTKILLLGLISLPVTIYFFDKVELNILFTYFLVLNIWDYYDELSLVQQPDGSSQTNRYLQRDVIKIYYRLLATIILFFMSLDYISGGLGAIIFSLGVKHINIKDLDNEGKKLPGKFFYLFYPCHLILIIILKNIFL